MAAKSDKFFGSHELTSREEQVTGGTDRGFGLVFACVFCLVAAFSWYRQGATWPWWLGAASAFGVAALAWPQILSPLNRAWTRFGLLLFTVMNPIVLGIVFFLCVAPMGLALRLFGKDLLSLKMKPEADSYWINRAPPGPKPDSLSNQF